MAPNLYTPKVGGLIKLDGSILPEFKEAIDRGVILDVAQGGTNFGVENAKVGIANGIIPQTISTDASSVAISRTAEKGMARINRRYSDDANSHTCGADLKDPVFSLTAIMSKFLALGFSVEQVIEMTTINPAKAISEDQRRGSVKVGMNADVTILKLVEQDVLFPDRVSDLELEGKYILVPKLTLKSQQPRVEKVSPTV